ncbi:MAG TPA: hypothetical protein VGO93_18645 [Candidatus Xenobia bacterium]|jgi:hypothetical protein
MATIPNGIPPSLIALCPHMKALAAQAQAPGQADPLDSHAGSASAAIEPSPAAAQPAVAEPAAAAEPALEPVSTAAPDASVWASADHIQTVLKHAATVSTPSHPLGDIIDNSLTGRKAELFDAETTKEITQFQQRQAKTEGSDNLNRLIHRDQLFGGQAQVHWNPAMNGLLKMFGMDSQQAVVRISDASNEPDPNGKSMYGFALEVIGQDGQPSDILMTGGSPLTEHSQARDPQAQLDLFNMLNPPNKVEGLARIVSHEGPVSGPRMILDVEHMKTNLDSAANLTAWSRAPFALQGRDGQTYLVKMRAVPVESHSTASAAGERSGQRLQADFQQQLAKGDLRWRLDFQFAQPKVDDVDDPRENWHGPWLTAGEIVVPSKQDPRAAQRAEDTRFSVWKTKEHDSVAVDKDVLKPFGEINRARQAAYAASGGNRGCPFLAAQKG